MLLSNGLWAFFPVLTVLILSSIPPLLAGGISTLIAGLVLFIWAWVRGTLPQLRIRAAWPHVLGATLIIGVWYYGLNFFALQHTTAGNQSLLALAEVPISFLVFGVIFATDSVRPMRAVGAALALLGTVLVLLPGWSSFSWLGDGLVLLAASTVTFGNHFAKKALQYVDAEIVMMIRSLVAGTILLVAGLLLEPMPTLAQFHGSALFLFINGALFMALSKIAWLWGLSRIGITHATSFILLTAPLTLIIAYFILGDIPTWGQLIGFVPIAIGIYLLTHARAHQ